MKHEIQRPTGEQIRREGRIRLVTAALLLTAAMVLAAGCAPEHRLYETSMVMPPGFAGAETSPYKQQCIDALKTSAGLEPVLKLAASNNPMAYAAWYRYRAAQEGHAQAVALPDPQLAARYFFHRGDSNGLLELSQTIPFPTKLSAAGAVADAEADAAGVRFDTAVRDAIADAKDAWFELYYIDRAEAITQAIAALYERYAALGAGGAGGASGTGGDGAGADGGGGGAEGGGMPGGGKAGAGAAPQLPELFRAQSQLAQVQYDLAMLKEMRAAQVERLLAILGLQPGTEIGPTEEVIAPPALKISLADLRARATEHSQELLAARIELVRSERAIDAADRTWLPDLTVGLSYEDMKDLPQKKDPIGVMVGVSLPLWWNKYNAISRQAQAEHQAALAEQAGAQTQLNAALAKAYFSLNNASRLVRLYNLSLLPQARQAQRSVEELYRKGDANLASVLETTSTLHNFELAHLRATVDFYQNVARVEKLVGTALELTPVETPPETTKPPPTNLPLINPPLINPAGPDSMLETPSAPAAPAEGK